MNTLQLECFLSVARNHSFSGAARERYISQPTISKHIRNLEEELRVELFRRDYMSANLTPAGEIYYKLFSGFMEGLRQAGQQVKELEDGMAGGIRLGLLYGWHLPEPLIRGFEDFRAHFPEITISVENHSFKELITRLNNGMLDACIHLQDFLDLVDNVQAVPLLEVPKYLVYAPQLAPGDREVPEVCDFRNCIYYCVAEHARSPVMSQMVKYCDAYGFSPRVELLPNIESVLSNVAFGNGVTILDGFTRISDGRGLRLLEMAPPHRASMAWPKTSNNQLLPLLAGELRCYFENQKRKNGKTSG